MNRREELAKSHYLIKKDMELSGVFNPEIKIIEARLSERIKAEEELGKWYYEAMRYMELKIKKEFKEWLEILLTSSPNKNIPINAMIIDKLNELSGDKT